MMLKQFNQYLKEHSGVLIREGEREVHAAECFAEASELDSPLVSVFLAQPSIDAIAGLVSIMSEGDTIILPHLRWTEEQQYPYANSARVAVETLPIENSFRTIVFTSGSTGDPKPILHSWSHHEFAAQASAERIPFEVGDTWLHTLPLYHVGGLSIVMRAVVGGGTIVLPEQGQSLSQAVQTIDFSHISLVPTQLYRLMQDEQCRQKLSQATCVLVGGAPLPESLAKQALEAEIPVFVTYGCTEAASQIATSRLVNASDLSAEPLKGYGVSVEDNELVVASSSLGKQFDAQSEFVPIQRHSTGDIGSLTNGRVTIVGRKDNMFISGGENIHPETIEAALLTCAGVEEAYVVPIQDAEFGQRPMAFVTLLSTASEQEVDEELSGVLPRFMVPKFYAEIPEYTRTGVKVSRKQLTAYASSYASFSRE